MRNGHEGGSPRAAAVLRTATMLVPAVVVLAFCLAWLMPTTRQATWRLLGENRPVEIVTFLSLIAGGLLGLDLARRLWTRRAGWLAVSFYVLFSLGLILVAMEEIAWGQWFFGFETPEAIRWRNHQDELTLHNLGFLHGRNSLLRVSFAVGGLCGLALIRWRPLRYLAPSPILLSWFLVIGVCAGAEMALDLDWLSPLRGDFDELVRHKLPEIVEMLVGLAGALYVVGNRRRLSSAAGAGSPGE